MLLIVVRVFHRAVPGQIIFHLGVEAFAGKRQARRRPWLSLES